MTAPALRRNPPIEPVIEALRRQFGDRLSTAAAVREQHGKDESYHPPAAPDAPVVVDRHTDFQPDNHDDILPQRRRSDHLLSAINSRYLTAPLKESK